MLFANNPTKLFSIKSLAQHSEPKINYKYAKEIVLYLVESGLIEDFEQYNKSTKLYKFREVESQ